MFCMHAIMIAYAIQAMPTLHSHTAPALLPISILLCSPCHGQVELVEVVDFFARPELFRRSGARVPRGVLLCGPPGTGKTLLARSVAGDARVTFVSLNSSEFGEMFAGGGAARVRDLFAQVRAACLLICRSNIQSSYESGVPAP